MENNYIKTNNPRMSEDVRAFMKAFIPARLKMQSAAKANKGNFGKYADINSIYDASIEVLGEAGIAINHFGDKENGKPILYTRLTHYESGQWIEDLRDVLLDKEGNQGRGSGNTYSRKLGVLNLCALGCEDDDCDLEKDKPKEEPKQDGPISIEQAAILEIEINKSANPEKLLNAVRGFNRISEIVELPASRFENVKSYILKNRG